MRSWSVPDVPALPVQGPPVRIHDTATGTTVTTRPDGPARLYVCGITPYDATHMGHAATYVGFDLLNRAWRNAGHPVVYCQNVTDVDDPLLERAAKIHVDWRELAERETDLFREDMAALNVLAPDHYVGAVESIPLVLELIERLDRQGATYDLEGDRYFAISADPEFGTESNYERERMLSLSAERGGDPERPGKKDALDCLLWLRERPGEPSWESPYGAGRPGWHVECSAIALEYLGPGFDVQGGGSDLVFPHHEYSAAEARAAAHDGFAQAYAHAGMVAYEGEKMSKSRGNLVFVSTLRSRDIDPMGIRLMLLQHHYRSDWEWFEEDLWSALDQLDRWRRAVALPAGAATGPVVEAVLSALADDLDAPTALAAVDAWATASTDPSAADAVSSDPSASPSEPGAGAVIRALTDAALGLRL